MEQLNKKVTEQIAQIDAMSIAEKEKIALKKEVQSQYRFSTTLKRHYADSTLYDLGPDIAYDLTIDTSHLSPAQYDQIVDDIIKKVI